MTAPAREGRRRRRRAGNRRREKETESRGREMLKEALSAVVSFAAKCRAAAIAGATMSEGRERVRSRKRELDGNHHPRILLAAVVHGLAATTGATTPSSSITPAAAAGSKRERNRVEGEN
ncbi:hypothetical protein PIB30_014786 [Stylosanthes scabra]|uniref:Uncharacterized protein n=1 Tax=Stylosanthes scabra TaxID=79078 RepID=A0ABU6Z699_9FABA|nr:hypothetical protein [Stylosanthes scabra]